MHLHSGRLRTAQPLSGSPRIMHPLLANLRILQRLANPIPLLPLDRTRLLLLDRIIKRHKTLSRHRTLPLLGKASLQTLLDPLANQHKMRLLAFHLVKPSPLGLGSLLVEPLNQAQLQISLIVRLVVVVYLEDNNLDFHLVSLLRDWARAWDSNHLLVAFSITQPLLQLLSLSSLP